MRAVLGNEMIMPRLGSLPKPRDTHESRPGAAPHIKGDDMTHQEIKTIEVPLLPELVEYARSVKMVQELTPDDLQKADILFTVSANGWKSSYAMLRKR